MSKIGSYFVWFVFLLAACEDKVKRFDGFIQLEMEHLLAGGQSKAWERIGEEADGIDLDQEDCDLDNYLIFLAGEYNNGNFVQSPVGEPKPLLYAYNPFICDSLDFCQQHPDFCQSNTTLCTENAEFCATLPEGILYIGSWYTKKPFIENDRTDTLVFTINNQQESIFVKDINSQYATFQYKNRVGENGGMITEYFQYSAPDSE